MGCIRLYQFAVVEIDGRAVKAGDLSLPRSVTISDDELVDQTFKVGPETAVKIWDAAENEAMSDFDLMWLESDFDLLIQYTTDPGVTDVYFVHELKGSGNAGDMGPALVLASDLAHKLDGSVDSFDGTESTIREVWAYNESATQTARVRVLAAT